SSNLLYLLSFPTRRSSDLFIPFTIHEFPSYSYVVADLHGHVFDIPFVLLTLALLVVFLVHQFDKKRTAIKTRSKSMRFLWYKKRSEEHTSELQSRGHLVCR